MRKLFVAVALAAGLWAGGVQAADCGAQGSTSAEMVPASEFSGQGFAVGAMLGLEPKEFPHKEIGPGRASCRRLDFEVKGKTWTLFGGADGQPPRWATADGKLDRVIFLAWMPWPKDAEAWARSGSQEANFNRMAVAMTIAEGDLRKVYILYDDVPDDARLVILFRAALDGTLKPFATYNVRTHRLQ